MAGEKRIEHLETKQNPFVYNKPVFGNDFFNREETVKRILKETVTGKSQGNVWITGERQVGKTSILNYIHQQFGSYDKRIKLYPSNEHYKVAFVFLNAQGIRNRDNFYVNLWQTLKNPFDFKIEPLKDAFTNFTDAIKFLLGTQNYYVVFLLDEFDALVKSIATADKFSAASFLDELNELIEVNNEIRFGCIFTANRTYNDLMAENELDKLGSGLVTEHIELPWFTKEQVNRLARQYLKNDPIQFSDKETDFCFQLTQGYPYFVQKLFAIMYDYKLMDTNPKSYLAKVKKEYGSTFKETVNGWGAASIPKRTLEKLKDLAGHIIKDAKDNAMSAVFKGIETYLKAQLNL